MTDPTDAQPDDDLLEPGGILCVELLSADPFDLRPQDYLDELTERCGKIDGTVGEDMAMAFHLDSQVGYADGAIPSQTLLCRADKPPNPASYGTALSQAWDWDDASKVVAGCTHSLLLTDLMAQGLTPKQRLAVFEHALGAALATHPAQALYFKNSDRMVEPATFQDAVAHDSGFFAGPVNVRLFNLEGPMAGEMVMDSLGMLVFGLPDVQCHYKDMEPSEVANFLYNLAAYLFDKGDVIQDGNTVDGVDDDTWSCQHEVSMVDPKRVILDVNPGRFAGTR